MKRESKYGRAGRRKQRRETERHRGERQVLTFLCAREGLVGVAKDSVAAAEWYIKAAGLG